MKSSKNSVKYQYTLHTTFEGKATTLGTYPNRRLARERKRFVETQGSKFGKVSIIQLKTVEKKVR